MSEIIYPVGVFEFDNPLRIPRGTSLRGAGIGKTIFKFNGNFPSCIETDPSNLSLLPKLTEDAEARTRHLTLTNTLGISPGDLIQIWNPKEYSFSGHRANYHSGETVEVIRINGNTLRLRDELFESYDMNEVNLYRVDQPNRCTLSDFEVQVLSNSAYALRVADARSTNIRNIRASGAKHSGLFLQRGYRVNIEHCEFGDDDIINMSDYGLSIANCQRINVLGGYYRAARHGTAVGGGPSLPGAIPNRLIDFYGCDISSSNELHAADIHGNTTDSAYRDCTIRGGVGLRGNRCSLLHCRLIGSSNYPATIHLSEMLGCSFKIDGNEVDQHKPAESRGCFIDVGGNSITAMNQHTVLGGYISVTNNTLRYLGLEEVNGAIRIYNRGSIVSECRLFFSGNTIESNVPIEQSIRVRKIAGTKFASSTVQGNALRGDVSIVTSASDNIQIGSNHFV